MSPLQEKFGHRVREQLELIRDALAVEADETRRMLETYARYLRGEIGRRELWAANRQLRDFLKTLGLGTLALLPFSLVTLPLLLKLAERFEVDLLPEWFRELETRQKDSSPR